MDKQVYLVVLTSLVWLLIPMVIISDSETKPRIILMQLLILLFEVSIIVFG